MNRRRWEAPQGATVIRPPGARRSTSFRSARARGRCRSLMRHAVHSDRDAKTRIRVTSILGPRCRLAARHCIAPANQVPPRCTCIVPVGGPVGSRFMGHRRRVRFRVAEGLKWRHPNRLSRDGVRGPVSAVFEFRSCIGDEPFGVLCTKRSGGRSGRGRRGIVAPILDGTGGKNPPSLNQDLAAPKASLKRPTRALPAHPLPPA
jgi:hypothetical protein